MAHWIIKRNTPLLRQIVGAKLHKSSKILINSFSGHRNLIIFVFFHAQEPLVYKMPKGWWDISLEYEIRHFNVGTRKMPKGWWNIWLETEIRYFYEKSLVQNFTKFREYWWIHLADIETSQFLSFFTHRDLKFIKCQKAGGTLD